MKHSMTREARWTERRGRGWLLGAALAVIPAAHAQAPRFSVTSEQVVAAMRGHAWSTEGVQVTLPAAMTAAVANPKLGVEKASMLTAHEARLRIVCRVPAACLPFFATAVWPESMESVLPPPPGRSADEAKRKRAEQPSTNANESSAGRLRAGASVTLLLDGERVHIQMQAVCLQGGATGDKVRVATRDRRQTYAAEIVSSSVLRGSLSQ